MRIGRATRGLPDTRWALWFSTTNGLVVVNPNRLLRNNIPPPVQITAVVINGQLMNAGPNLQLKPFEKNVEIRYSGLSFVSPEKVAFRYMLDGYDKTWTDAGARREAFFTNLSPGNFRFKVVARNADGIWSEAPASLAFTIEPRLYQRVWFFPLLGFALLLAAAAGYRMRIGHLKRRFDLVLAERTRIARELHDTLIQGLSGVTMQLQALWTKLPPSKEKVVLAAIIGDAGRCSTEARQSLWGLRMIEPEVGEFSDKLATLARQAVAGRPTSLLLDLEPVSLSALPNVEYRLLCIAKEAMSNTLKHAHAKTLSIGLLVRDRRIELALEDDGDGFVVDTEEGRFGHFGLLGMRERASEIGAELAVSSSPGVGAKVSIRLPLSRFGMPEGNLERSLEHQIE